MLCNAPTLPFCISVAGGLAAVVQGGMIAPFALKITTYERDFSQQGYPIELIAFRAVALWIVSLLLKLFPKPLTRSK